MDVIANEQLCVARLLEGLDNQRQWERSVGLPQRLPSDGGAMTIDLQHGGTEAGQKSPESCRRRATYASIDERTSLLLIQ